MKARMASVLVTVASITQTAAAADTTPHPWDGAARPAWVAEAAHRVFKQEGPPDLAPLFDLCVATCPESAYVRPEPTSPEREVHAIGVYEGPGDRRGEPPPSDPGAIDVRIRWTQKPVVLLLMSHEPVVWRVHLDEGARLEQVRLAGDGRVELPPGGPSVQRVERLPSVYSLSGAESEFETGDSEKTLRSLERAAGSAVDSFQGSYKATGFTVPFVQDQDLAREIGLGVRALQSAKTSTAPSPFDLVVGGALVRFDPRDAHGGRRTLIAFDSKEPVRGAVEVDGTVYAITESTLFAQNSRTGAMRELQIPVGYPDPGRWSGITYDAKAKRLVMIAESSPYAYTHDPASGEWRLFPWDYKTRPPLFGGAITFDPDAGVLYGLSVFWPPQSSSGMAVVVLDSLLHPQRAIPLSDRDAIPLGIDPEVQLAKAGDALVLHVRPGFTGGFNEACLLISLQSGGISKLPLCAPSGAPNANKPRPDPEFELSPDDF